MKVTDIKLTRDPIMEVYRGNVEFGNYTMRINLEKPSNLYSIMVSHNNQYVNLDGINPGSTITSFLSESDMNQRLKAMEKYASENQ